MNIHETQDQLIIQGQTTGCEHQQPDYAPFVINLGNAFWLLIIPPIQELSYALTRNWVRRNDVIQVGSTSLKKVTMHEAGDNMYCLFQTAPSSSPKEPVIPCMGIQLDLSQWELLLLVGD